MAVERFILNLNYTIEEQLDELNELYPEIYEQIRIYFSKLNNNDED